MAWWNRSSVAGIVDSTGGLRIVVSKKWQMRYHVQNGERLFIVPGLKVQDPVSWEDQPSLINIVENYIKQKLSEEK